MMKMKGEDDHHSTHEEVHFRKMFHAAKFQQSSVFVIRIDDTGRFNNCWSVLCMNAALKSLVQGKALCKEHTRYKVFPRLIFRLPWRTINITHKPFSFFYRFISTKQLSMLLIDSYSYNFLLSLSPRSYMSIFTKFYICNQKRPMIHIIFSEINPYVMYPKWISCDKSILMIPRSANCCHDPITWW